jgi:hypothetical protein
VHRLGATLLAGSACLLAACAVPLGPGYRIERQRVELRYAAADPGRVYVRSSYVLRNNGNAPLEELDTALPAALAGEGVTLRVLVDGREVRARKRAPVEGEEADYLTVPFDPPWPQKRRLALVLEYALPVEGGAAGEAFSFAADDWFPALHPPERLFARGTARGERVDVSLRVPEGFLALTSGSERGIRRRAGEIKYRFRLGAEDFSPFVVAGRFLEHKFASREAVVVFWSPTALDPAHLQTAGARLTAALHAYESALGPREPKTRRPLWIVLRGSGGETPGPAESFPHGLHLSTANLGESRAAANGLCRVEAALGALWLGEVTSPAEPAVELNAALVRYAGATLAEGCAAALYGTDDRAGIRTALLREGRETAAELAQASGAENEAAEKRLARQKAMLVPFLLEERVGRERLLAALRRLVQARRGDDWNIHDLRSALEAETGQDLAPFFHDWLIRPGLPEGLR